MTGRIILITLCLISAYILILLRLFYWQVIRHPEIKELAISQSSNSLVLPARRGEIRTSDNYPLATNKISYLLHANPKSINDKLLASDRISQILELDEGSVSAQLKKDLYWVRLASNLDLEKRKAVERLNLSGLGFQENSSRYYPESSMSAQVMGFVGKDDSGRSKGYFGIEGYYDTQLGGRDGRLYTIHDALGNIILNDIREEKKIDGRDLELTIDRTIQFIAEKELKDGVERYEAEGGTVIVMQPSTGKVLAMASYPRFDPQTYYDFDSSTFKNPAISNLFEPGSTFKVLVMSAALDAQIVKPDTKCTICSEPVQVGEYKIKTWNEKYYPNSSMTEVIQHSDNTGMVFVAQKLGLDKLLYYLKNFGIDEPTGIDLQGEISGTIKNKEEWYTIDLATASFGQGISVTPMQLITAVNAIPNDGYLMTPYTVGYVYNEQGKKIPIKPQQKRKVISSTTATIMKEMMVNAIEKGESKYLTIKNYKIAGKTGTAQIPVEGRYDPENTIASFVGFYPADKPEVIMLVTVTKPKTKIFGSETAAPIFFAITKKIINYLNIPPSF